MIFDEMRQTDSQPLKRNPGGAICFVSDRAPVDCTADNQFNITNKRPVDR